MTRFPLSDGIENLPRATVEQLLRHGFSERLRLASRSSGFDDMRAVRRRHHGSHHQFAVREHGMRPNGKFASSSQNPHYRAFSGNRLARGRMFEKIGAT